MKNSQIIEHLGRFSKKSRGSASSKQYSAERTEATKSSAFNRVSINMEDLNRLSV